MLVFRFVLYVKQVQILPPVDLGLVVCFHVVNRMQKEIVLVGSFLSE